MVLLSQRYVLAFVAFFGQMSLGWLRLNIGIYKTLETSGTETFIANIVYNFGLTCACFGGILVTRFGGASLFGIAISASAKINLSTHLIYRLGFIPLLPAIFVQGFFHAIAQCAVADLWSRWSAPEERFILVAMTFLGAFVGEISHPEIFRFVGNYMYFYYITGGVAFIWALLWMFVIKVKNDPDDDKHVSDDEKQYLANKIQIADKNRHNVISYPWKSIFTSRPFWILCLTSFIFTIGEKFSTSIREDITIQHFSNIATNLTVAGEIVLILIVACAAYWIAKKKKYTRGQTRKFYISLVLLVGAKSLTAYFYYPQYFRHINFTVLQAAVLGYLKIAFLVNAIDLSPKYSGILYGIQICLRNIAEAIGSQLIHLDRGIVDICIKAVIVLYLLSALLNHYCGSGELQPWNNPKREQLELQARKNDETA